MTAIERTAYRRLKAHPTPTELADLFTPSLKERELAASAARGHTQQLAFLALLKCYQCLLFFPDLDQVPVRIIQYLRTCLDLPPQTPCIAPKRSRLRYHAFIRTHLGMIFDPKRARAVAATAIQHAARTMDHPADLINVALETLAKEQLETPAFSTLDRIAGHVRTKVNGAYIALVEQRLTEGERHTLEALLVVDGPTDYALLARVKEVPASATVSHIDDWLKRLAWLREQANTQRLLADIPTSKLRHFGEEARSLDVAELRDIKQPKRAVMVLALLHQTAIATTDELIQMLLKRMAAINKQGKATLQHLREAQQGTQEHLLDALADNRQSLTRH